jgi:hypothetical protein
MNNNRRSRQFLLFMNGKTSEVGFEAGQNVFVSVTALEASQ